MKQVLCDNFRQEQFVPARQVRTVLSVYVASREERHAANGLGCSVKDLMTGEEKRIKISDLMKMRVQYPNGKPVKAFTLRGGQTYTMVGVPAQQNFGVFIVPRGGEYEFSHRDKTLSPMSVVLSDGKTMRVIDYRLFRKLFVMMPNPVSSGQMRSGRVRQGMGQSYGQPQQANAFDMFRRPAQQAQPTPQPTYQPTPQPTPQPQHPQGFQPHGVPPYQATPQHGQAQTNTGQLFAVGRIMRGDELVGLVLSDGRQQLQFPYKQCWDFAEAGKISNVKAVRSVLENGKKYEYLSGVGISLKNLPTLQI